MRAKQFITELRPKKKKAAEIPYDPQSEAYEELQAVKEASTGNHPCNTLQLFMPRRHASAKTRYQKHLDNISNTWATDDQGEVKPRYQAWADKHPDAVTEAAPIIAAGKMVPPGNNKPSAILWTSTAKKSVNNTYVSDWVRWVSGNQSSWMSETGYIYKVNPNATILQLDSDHEAERIYGLFQKLGRGATAEFDNRDGYYSRVTHLYKDFPWGEIAKHFDGVTHFPSSYGRNEFLYGWDCESTAWFNPSVLTLLGEVKINQAEEDDDE